MAKKKPQTPGVNVNTPALRDAARKREQARWRQRMLQLMSGKSK